MARSYARLSVAIWYEDDDFLALDPIAKLVYLFVLSQSKLTLAGCIDVRLDRWAPRLGLSIDDLQQALDRLEDTRFVVTDPASGELVVRSFTRHDVSKSPKVLAGMWSAWKAIESRHLRHVVLVNMPDEAFIDKRVTPLAERPTEALSDTQPIRYRKGIEYGTDTPQPLPQPLPEPAAAAAHDEPAPTSAKLTKEQRQRIIHEAIGVLTDRHLDRNPSTGNPQRHREAVHRGKLSDHHQTGHSLLTADATLTATRLANMLEPASAPPTPYTSDDDLLNTPTSTPAQRITHGTDGCPCDGYGWLEPDGPGNGSAPCPGVPAPQEAAA